MAIVSKTITIYGHVQNVGFRYHTLQAANAYGIMGFVKNQMDGTVYIEAEAEEIALNEFINWCRKGPGHSKVTKIQIGENPNMQYSSFTIKR